MRSEESQPSENAVAQELAGRLFYSPNVIAAYCVFSLPLGLLLYGLNLTRGWNRVMGYALTGISAVAVDGLLLASALGARISDISKLGALGLFVGIGVLNTEGGAYRRALSRGGATARWWTPLLWALGVIVVVAISRTIVRMFRERI